MLSFNTWLVILETLVHTPRIFLFSVSHGPFFLSTNRVFFPHLLSAQLLQAYPCHLFALLEPSHISSLHLCRMPALSFKTSSSFKPLAQTASQKNSCLSVKSPNITPAQFFHF